MTGPDLHLQQMDAMHSHTSMFAPWALLPTGWAADVSLSWGSDGRYKRVEAGTRPQPDMVHAVGPVLPGLTNLHSHAFQRAFAGLTEYRAEDADSFWSWRTLMYGFAAAISPEQVEAVATFLYGEMLAAGYTSVCEFHYLHHDTGGRPYADTATLAQALLRAAKRSGIHITLLPVLYQAAGFGGTPLGTGQQRFGHTLDSMQRLLQALAPQCAAQGARLGLAPHSLRAVPPQALTAALAMLDDLDPTAPVHIHIAEQTKEVDDCLAHTGQRPVDWLLDHAPVDRRWCLVHATHMTPDESRRAARSGAVAGLCPSTEANLGDGIFDMAPWREGQGAWGVGSDSHACVNAAQELELLEYSQRWLRRQRNVLADPVRVHVAEAMMQAAVVGGAQAAGRLTPTARGPGAAAVDQPATTGLQVGAPADAVVLDAHDALLGGLGPQDMLSAHVFASHRQSAIAQVWAGGVLRATGGRHLSHEGDAARFVEARRALLDRMA